MAQGKLKIKTKLPASTKVKANKQGKKNKKSPAVQRRANAPVQSKKAKFQESYKLKKMITKTVNSTMEDELRQKALEGKKSLTKKEPSKSQKM